MTALPETRFARSGELMIVYQVMGEDQPLDLVIAPGTVSHLDLELEYWPQVVREYEWMTRYCRLIRFDKRGTGLSDRGVYAATLEERTDDIRAVMDAAGSERAFVIGFSEGGCMACTFAATYPQRTRGLILWGTMPRYVQTDDYPWGFDPVEHQRIVGEMSEQGMTREYLTGLGAGMTGLADEEVDRALGYARAAASPTQMAALERMNQDMDIRDILSTIHVPTLILRLNDPCAHIDAVRRMASQIPNARLIEFPGDTHEYSLDNPDDAGIFDALEEFITGERAAPRGERVLSTVLFTDIVGSTEAAAKLGDDAWKQVLAKHHDLVRSELRRFRGCEIKTAGDGFLATFDGPGRAVRCGQAITAGVGTLGLDVRAGAHTGEIELTDADIGGIAVHIGARVAALANASEVLVSSTVKDLTAGSGLIFEDAGDHELKGVPDRWHLYRLVK